MRRSFEQSLLSDLRAVSSVNVLASLATHIKADPTFAPCKDARTQRWHVYTAGGHFEILTTGPKWYDTRARLGGGSAIDLTMHLLNLGGVSRNSVYRYHPKILAALRLHQQGLAIGEMTTRSPSPSLERSNSMTQEQVTKLAALVDHYAAYREARATIDCRDREISELRRTLDVKPSPLRR